MTKVIIAILLLSLCACSADTGWRVEFGAHPINALQDKRALEREQQLIRAKY